MKIVIAGQGDVGGPLTVAALRMGRDVEVTVFDTIIEHRERLLRWVEENDYPNHVMAGWKDGRLKVALDAADLTEFDVAVFTPNCMVDAAPHTRWTRFCREMIAIGRQLRKGGMVILHCTSLRSDDMMRDAESFLRKTSGLTAGKDYCLAWTGLLEGQYETPEYQVVMVAGWSPSCEEQATAFMATLVEGAESRTSLQAASKVA